jgi:hypothetical protein
MAKNVEKLILGGLHEIFLPASQILVRRDRTSQETHFVSSTSPNG